MRMIFRMLMACLEKHVAVVEDTATSDGQRA